MERTAALLERHAGADAAALPGRKRVTAGDVVFHVVMGLFSLLFFLPLARKVRESVKAPLILLGGALSTENLEAAMRARGDVKVRGGPEDVAAAITAALRSPLPAPVGDREAHYTHLSYIRKALPYTKSSCNARRR